MTGIGEAAAPIRLGLVGIGKIARDQHLPAIAADPRFALVATADRNAALPGVPAYADIDALLDDGHRLDAVSICTPPARRHAIACRAIDAGLHVMLEKPPAATVQEVADLAKRAPARGVALFAAWHSRGAAGVAPARAWLAERDIRAVRIAWQEDIRRWHPGQDWILAALGFGVFDPGINALSIVTRILPAPVVLDRAEMTIPAGRESPIAARLAMRSGAARVDAVFDFLQTGPQRWDIEVDTDRGTLSLTAGGSVLALPGAEAITAPDREYPRLYDRFAGLVARREIDADADPLRLVLEALASGNRVVGQPFNF